MSAFCSAKRTTHPLSPAPNPSALLPPSFVTEVNFYFFVDLLQFPVFDKSVRILWARSDYFLLWLTDAAFKTAARTRAIAAKNCSQLVAGTRFSSVSDVVSEQWPVAWPGHAAKLPHCYSRNRSTSLGLCRQARTQNVFRCLCVAWTSVHLY